MRRFPRIASLALVGAVALSIAACSSAAPGGGDERADVGAIVQPDDAATNVEPSREPIPPRELSPFDEFRNILWSLDMDEDSRLRQFDADRLRQEDLIAQCMNELGFEYIPYLGWHTFSSASGAWQPDDPDWVAQFGFGVTTPPPGGSGVSGSGIDIHDLGPNNDILESLSEEGRLAWLGAFHRSGAGWERIIGTIDWTFRDCGNWSWNLIQYEHQLVNTEEFAPLLDAIAEMHHNLQWDITNAERDWSLCMADAGYVGFDSPWLAEDSVVREYNGLRTRLAGDPDWEYDNPTVDNSPEFAALQEHELELATVSLNCRIYTDFEAKRAAHIHAVENQFITDHRAALEALRSAAEQRS